MKRTVKIIATLLAIYVIASAAITACYHADGSPMWEIACHRCGLMILDMDNTGIYMLNPLNNYGDDWIMLYKTR